MDSKLIAKILPTKKDGKRTIGTGYPIGKDLVLTARHVLFPDGDDIGRVEVEWTGLNYSSFVTEVVFDGGEACDIAVIRCQTPPQAHVSVWMLGWQTPNLNNRWDSLGYSRLGKDEDMRSRVLVSAFGEFHHPNDTHIVKLKSNSILEDKDNWKGLSGAAVFQGSILYAVITEVKGKDREERFSAVYIPYLLAENAAFRQAVGYSENNHHQQFFLGEILNYLKNLQGLPLFQALVKHFVGEGLQPIPQTLLQAIQVAVNCDPIAALEQLRVVCEPVMKADHASVQQAKNLLCLVLGLVAAAGGQAENNGIHELAVRTRMMVEVSLATRYRVRPDLAHEKAADAGAKDAVVGRYALDGECLPEVGWSPSANATEIAKVVNVAVNKAHKQVYGDEPKNTLDEFDLADLNETLVTRRKNERPQLIRFEVASSDVLKTTHPLHDDSVCAALHDPACLPDLPIVRYGLGTAAKEAQLRAQVNEFFRIIQQYS